MVCNTSNQPVRNRLTLSVWIVVFCLTVCGLGVAGAGAARTWQGPPPPPPPPSPGGPDAAKKPPPPIPGIPPDVLKTFRKPLGLQIGLKKQPSGLVPINITSSAPSIDETGLKRYTKKVKVKTPDFTLSGDQAISRDNWIFLPGVVEGDRRGQKFYAEGAFVNRISGGLVQYAFHKLTLGNGEPLNFTEFSRSLRPPEPNKK